MLAAIDPTPLAAPAKAGTAGHGRRPAAFLLNVVVSRLVATQREQIAALKALGDDNRAMCGLP